MYNIFGNSKTPQLALQCEKEETFNNYIKTVLSKCFTGEKLSTVEEREKFFKNVHKCRLDEVLIKDGVETIQKITSSATEYEINVFIQECMMDLIGEIIKERVNMEKNKSTSETSTFSDQDNKVLYYIAGFILCGLEKKYNKVLNKALREKKLKSLCMLEKDTSEGSFWEKYSTWLDKKNRGGLKKPCDNFFLLVREFELEVRKYESQNTVSSNNKEQLKERIFDSFMVGHYNEKLFPQQLDCADEEQSENLSYIEDTIELFLTVRGYAKARALQNQFLKTKKNELRAKSSASLRESLQCISNKK